MGHFGTGCMEHVIPAILEEASQVGIDLAGVGVLRDACLQRARGIRPLGAATPIAGELPGV